MFAIRPAFGVYAIVIARPSIDLWADRSLANVGGIGLNPASALALRVHRRRRRLPVRELVAGQGGAQQIPYIGLATMAILSIAVAPSKGGAITETLRLLSVVVLYLAAYTLIRDRGR